MAATLMFVSVVTLSSQVTITVPGKTPPGVSASSSISSPVDQTSTFTAENTLVWKLTTNNMGKMQNWPGHYQNTNTGQGLFQLTTSDDVKVPGGATVSYACPSSPGPCNVAVFVYECAPCVTEKVGLAGYLAGQQFERSRCAPTFTLQDGGFQHRMTTFIKTIAAGAIEEITLPNDVEYAAFALSNGGGFMCSSKPDMTACNDPVLKGHCIWKSSECKLNNCVQSGPAPGACDVLNCPPSSIPLVR